MDEASYPGRVRLGNGYNRTYRWFRFAESRTAQRGDEVALREGQRGTLCPDWAGYLWQITPRQPDSDGRG